MRYAWHTSQEVGGLLRMWKALRAKNACKTYALGMGGQKGGMVNEIGGFPEVCKKSLQAMAADMQGRDKELRLMTVRSEGQFNTVVYEEEDLYRGQDRRDVILVNPQDIKRLGLTENERVTVHSETGSMPGILVRPFPQIKAGNALMYYPEANQLVGRRTDKLSRTPAFKGVVVTLERSQNHPG